MADLTSYQTVKEALLTGEFNTPPLPELVVDKIMDSARYWNVVSKETRVVTEVRHERKEYLSIELPAACRKVKMVVMECESHDQGWSSYPANQGSREGSWTWGDLAVVDKGNQEVYKHDRAYTNIHACDSWELHKREYSEEDKLVKHFSQPGRRLVLSLNARFPGWVNYAKYAKLSVHFT